MVISVSTRRYNEIRSESIKIQEKKSNTCQFKKQ